VHLFARPHSSAINFLDVSNRVSHPTGLNIER
jgi:hypothetical protein